MKRSRALLTTALPTVLVAALALTGCAGGGTDDQAQNCTPAGEASKSVKLEGDFGAAVTLASDTPITVSEVERSVLIEGDGEELQEGDSAEAFYTVFNGKTGETLSPGSTISVKKDAESVPEWALKAVECSAIGDRVVAVLPASEMLGAGVGEQYNIADDDALIAVFDFTGLALSRAEGTPMEAPEGFPTVELAEDGAPTITIPEGKAAPTELEVATLIEGDGAVVGETDTVTLHYTGAVWSNGEVFDSSWANGSPLTLGANQFVPGFTKAIVGQKVGSQIIAVIPASEGYGEDTASRLSAAGATADDVMVFVVDILSTTPAAG